MGLRTEACERCYGQGAVPLSDTCPDCRGTGVTGWKKWWRIVEAEMHCQNCHGHQVVLGIDYGSYVEQDLCPECYGTGYKKPVQWLVRLWHWYYYEVAICPKCQTYGYHAHEGPYGDLIYEDCEVCGGAGYRGPKGWKIRFKRWWWNSILSKPFDNRPRCAVCDQLINDCECIPF